MFEILPRLRLLPAVLALGSGLLAAAAPDPIPPTGGAGVTALAVALIQPAAPPASAMAAPAAQAKSPIQKDYGKLPYTFEANGGQADAAVKFLARGPGYTLFLTPGEAVLALQSGPAPAAAARRPRDPAAAPTAGDAAAGAVAAGGPAAAGTAAVDARSSDPTPAATAAGEPPADAALATPPAVLRLSLVGANPDPLIQGEETLSGTVNYLLGDDPAAWRTGVATYAKVRYHGVYPGIDLVYYGRGGQLEYDLVLRPEADPGVIRLAFEGADHMTLDDSGDLVLSLGAQQVIQHRPVVYQETDGTRTPIATRYVLADNRQVTLALEDYDRTRPLVIDPVLEYSTYLGGSGYNDSNDADPGYGIAVDAAGQAYVTGLTNSRNFPTRHGLQPDISGSDYGIDVFVAKLAADGRTLVYATYLGGTGWDSGFGIAVDATGQAYVTGRTNSRNFPTRHALQPHFGGGENDAFVAKLAANGSTLVYSTYLGGTGGESSHFFSSGIAVDATGQAYVTGVTQSTDFPTHQALQPDFGGGYEDAFVAKLAADGSTLVYATYLGGRDSDSGAGMAVDATGQAYVTGSTNSRDFPTSNALQPDFGSFGRRHDDAFIAKLSADGSTLVYSTYLGGSRRDAGSGIAVDATEQAYVTGTTSSNDFPTRLALQPKHRGYSDAFVAKLAADGSALVYSTYLGGGGGDGGSGIAVDAGGQAYVTGTTYSNDFPTHQALQLDGVLYEGDAFVTKLSADGSTLVYSTTLGGTPTEDCGAEDVGHGIAVDAAGQAYVTGYTNCSDFPTRHALQPDSGGGWDAFIAKIIDVRMRPVALAALAVGDGADTARLAVLTEDGAGAPTARILDGTGTVLRSLAFAPAYESIALAALPDLNGNGAAELALLSRTRRADAVQLEILDGLDGARLRALALDAADTPERLAVLADPTGTEVVLAVLSTRENAERSGLEAVTAALYDARSGAALGTVAFDPANRPLDFAALADADGNGAAELAVLGSGDPATRPPRTRFERRDSRGGAVIADVRLAAGASPLGLVEVSVSGAPVPAVLEQRNLRGGVTTLAAVGGAPLGQVWYHPDFQPRRVAALPDLDGNGVDEVGVLSRDAAGATKLELRDPLSGALVDNLGLERLTPYDLAVLPDLNGSPAVAVLGITPTNRVRVLVVDAATKAVLGRWDL